MIQHIDEVLSRAIATDATPVPRFDIEDENGNIIYPNCRLKLKNPITQAGTPVNKPLLDEFLAASGVTAGTATAFTLAQAGFVLADGATVRFRLHTASGSNATLNVAGTGAKAIVDLRGEPIPEGTPPGTWISAIYSASLGRYITSAGSSRYRIGTYSGDNTGDFLITMNFSGRSYNGFKVTGQTYREITLPIVPDIMYMTMKGLTARPILQGESLVANVEVKVNMKTETGWEESDTYDLKCSAPLVQLNGNKLYVLSYPRVTINQSDSYYNTYIIGSPDFVEYSDYALAQANSANEIFTSYHYIVF